MMGLVFLLFCLVSGTSVFEDELRNNSLTYKAAQERIPPFPFNATVVVTLMENKAKNLALMGRNCSTCPLTRCLGEWVLGTSYAPPYSEWIKVFNAEDKIRDASLILVGIYENVYDEWNQQHPSFEISRSPLAWTWCWEK